jgi:hypothetical protein
MNAETGVKWVLRFIALLSCLALGGIVMPPSYLAWFANKAQPGTPNGILTNYLFRILCLMYAWAGLQCWVYSTDVRRYIVLIRIAGVGSLLFTALAVAFLFVFVPPAQRSWFFWVVFVDMAEGFIQAVPLVYFLSRIRSAAV